MGLLLLIVDFSQLIDLILDEASAIFTTCTFVFIQLIFYLIYCILEIFGTTEASPRL